MTEPEQGPIQGTDALRIAILDDLAGWVKLNADAARAVAGVRTAVVRRVVDDLTDILLMGGAIKGRNEQEVVSQARVYLRRPLSEAGLGESLQSMVVAAKKTALRRLGSPHALADMADAAASLEAVSGVVDRIVAGTEAEDAVATGLTDLDGPLNGGLPRGELTLLGAGTGDGKTAFSMQIAEHAAQQDRGLVLVCSPEMQAKDLWLRAAMRASQVARRELRPGHPSQDRASAAVLAAASKASQRANLVLLDRVDADIGAALEAAYLIHEERGPLYLVVLDYAQQLTMDDERTPRYQLVGQVARQALELAMKTGAAVFLTSQINVSRDKNGNVIDTSYRESATIEHKATVALIMTVDKQKRHASIRIRKNRHGPQMTCKLYYRPEIFFFADRQDEGKGEW